ncbi:thioredoxin family protein [Bacillus sp. NPDC077027]|uniref:thioredoxin family protein n=1 Tax=Bacillus sp. NPDC077027 TaxID=3390548 RepID=UPI003CFECFC7
MKDIQEHELKNIQDDIFLLYLYTPFCGTCQLAKKMLTVVDKMQQDVPFYENNLNYSPNIAKALEIESVPCYLLFKKGELVKKGYAFHSVPYLHEMIETAK